MTVIDISIQERGVREAGWERGKGEEKGKRGSKVHMHTLVSFGLRSGDSAQMLNISSDYKTTT